MREKYDKDNALKNTTDQSKLNHIAYNTLDDFHTENT